jgi:hypothetical protein
MMRPRPDSTQAPIPVEFEQGNGVHRMRARPDSTQAPMPVEYEHDYEVHHTDAPPPYTAEELTGSIPQPGDTGVTSTFTDSHCPQSCAGADIMQTMVASTLTSTHDSPRHSSNSCRSMKRKNQNSVADIPSTGYGAFV